MNEERERQAEQRPIGNTPITDAAAANAPQNPAASNAGAAETNVEGGHMRDAEIAEYAQPSDEGAEGTGSDAMMENDPSRSGSNADSELVQGTTGFPISDEDESSITDEEDDEAEEAEFGAGTAEQNASRLDGSENRLGQ